ncbi:MAG: glycoside hydrolase family 3 N-terminal domain-containing protein [Brevinema sp.]
MIYKDSSYSFEQRVDDLISQMTVEEKTAQMTSVWSHEIMAGDFSCDPDKMKRKFPHGLGGVTRLGGATPLPSQSLPKLYNQMQRCFIENTRLGIPSIFHEESCSGAMIEGSTNFPQAIGLAASFNPELCGKMAEVIAHELAFVGAKQTLAPVLDICRDARWGRVEESFGEDPYLTTQMGLSYIKGIQKHHILATAKHLVAYGASDSALNASPVHISERLLREVYLLPFEACIKEAGLASVMPSYQENDGIPCHASKTILKKILREEWSFKGLLVSDYAGLDTLYEFHQIFPTKESVVQRGIDCEIDMELPIERFYGKFLAEQVHKGLVRIEDVDRIVRRILLAKFKLGLFDNPYLPENAPNIVGSAQSKELSLELSRESLVLLKNEGILPLDPLKKPKIAVIGPNAHSRRHQLGDYAYVPHLESLMKRFNKVISGERKDLEFTQQEAEKAIQKMKELEQALDGCSVYEGLCSLLGCETIKYGLGSQIFETNDDLLDEAEALATESDVIIAVLGDRAGVSMICTSGESRDRQHLSLLDGQEKLLNRLLEIGKPVILVLIHGRPIAIPRNHPNLKAVLSAWLPGAFGGQAIAETLLGFNNPGGKLPITFPEHSGQVPIYYSRKPSGTNVKGFVDGSMQPMYPFGFGLSYTSFEFSQFHINKEVVQAGDIIEVSCHIKNTGACLGDEVVQLYLRNNAWGITRPVKELKGFKRIRLDKGACVKVTFDLPIDIIACYDEEMNFMLLEASVDVMIGASSENIFFTKSIAIKKSSPVSTKVFSVNVNATPC